MITTVQLFKQATQIFKQLKNRRDLLGQAESLAISHPDVRTSGRPDVWTPRRQDVRTIECGCRKVFGITVAFMGLAYACFLVDIKIKTKI